jgi:RimJ/RimL family protein N-acetyltransferase
MTIEAEPIDRVPTVETPQLILRAPEPADLQPLYAIQGDPAAMAHTWWAPSQNHYEVSPLSWARAVSGRRVMDG